MGSESPVKIEITELSIEDERPSIVRPTAKALSDGSRDETPTPKYRHTWTKAQRTTLAILAENYTNKWSERTAVFNHFHRSDLRGCGGLRDVVVATQFHHIRKSYSYNRPKLASHAGLENAALHIGIQLQKATASPNGTTMSNLRHRPSYKRKRDRTDFLPELSSDDSQTAYVEKQYGLNIMPKTPTKQTGKRHKSGLQTPPDSRDPKLQRLTIDKKLARIGFRASTTSSQGKYSSVLGIRAGAFLNQATIPLAKNLESRSYYEEAIHHVKKHDYSHPSMFISATKNPMRAIHMLLHAPRGKRDLVLIDLHAADKQGNVEKASALRLHTNFKYSAAGEYLIFGGVPPEAIIANIPLSRLMDNIPSTPESDDPFLFKLLQRHNKLSNARRAIKGNIIPMTFCLGKAVGELVGRMYIPPKHYQTGVWALVQDYKFYNAEGGRRKGHWSENTAFEAGALQGYQASRGTLSNIEVEETKKLGIEIVEITDDSESDSDSDGDHQTPMKVDVERSRWTTREGDVSYFLGDLEELADSESHGQDETANLPPDCQRRGSDRENVQSGVSADEMESNYEYGWTGM